jgi:hypothetical protein
MCDYNRQMIGVSCSFSICSSGWKGYSRQCTARRRIGATDVVFVVIVCIILPYVGALGIVVAKGRLIVIHRVRDVACRIDGSVARRIGRV